MVKCVFSIINRYLAELWLCVLLFICIKNSPLFTSPVVQTWLVRLRGSVSRPSLHQRYDEVKVSSFLEWLAALPQRLRSPNEVPLHQMFFFKKFAPLTEFVSLLRVKYFIFIIHEYRNKPMKPFKRAAKFSTVRFHTFISIFMKSMHRYFQMSVKVLRKTDLYL